MKKNVLFILAVFLFSSSIVAQKIELNSKTLTAVKALFTEDKAGSVKVIMDTSVKLFDEPTFAKLTTMDFKNGTIEVKVLSKLLPNAGEGARGFIGVAFRINDDNKKFEGIYIRPTNGRADDQVRRNHSTQYFSYPNYKFSDLRKTDPEKYESYADMGLNEWITMKIVVQGDHARLYINDAKQPCLVVNDLKYGADMSGSIGIWVGPGTEGYFKDLKVVREGD